MKSKKKAKKKAAKKRVRRARRGPARIKIKNRRLTKRQMHVDLRKNEAKHKPESVLWKSAD